MSSARISLILSGVTVIPEMIRVIKPELDGGVADTQKLFVVAFDPGVSTGWCVMRVQLDALLRVGLKGVALGHPDPDVFSWRAGYFRGPEPWQAELMMALCRGTWMHGEGVFDQGSSSDLFVAVMEKFQLRTLGEDETLLSPVRIPAAFRAISWRAPFPVIWSAIPDAMKTFTDHRLNMFNLWSGQAGEVGEHQRDATRHAAMLVRKCIEAPWLAMLEARMPWLAG